MMSRFVLQKSFKVPGVRCSRHISSVMSDRVWISDYSNNLILTNTAGDKLHHLTGIGRGGGIHTVNIENDLIYIDSQHNINKLSTYNKVKTLIRYTAPWEPRCVYSSPSSTGDLLIGMYNIDTYTSKVVRYNSTGEHIQTIQHDNTGQELFRDPLYITENRNGDVIVSDYSRAAVVVTEREGRYRFSYTGPPSGSGLWPRGICTDTLSHILVCDEYTHTVQMLDRDGNSLSYIPTRQHGIDYPRGLCYDEKTHILWVGSWDYNTVNIYRVVYSDSLTGLPKCKDHPSGTLEDFCVPCEVPLCRECTSSEEHRGHDCRDVRSSLEDVHTQIDGDAVLMCLLLCKLYRINLKEGDWIEKYNAIAESYNFQKIKTESSPANLEKNSPMLKYNSSEIMFSHEFFRHASFLKFVEDPKFMDIFLTWAEKENIVEYCRTWIYPPKEDEVFCWLLPNQTERLIEKLEEDVFKHPTWKDTSIHHMVFSKVGIPMQIIMRGDESVRNFIYNLKKGRTVMCHASGMIVGCAGSGKTTLLERLKGIDLKEILKNTKSTRGIDVHTDIFDVSNTIKVNSSDQKQHFKIMFDETSKIHNVSEHPKEITDDLEKQDMEESMEGENLASEVGVDQMSEDNMELEADLSKEIKDVTLYDNPIEEIDESLVARHSEISGVLRVTRNVSDDPEKRITMVDFAGQCAYYSSHQIFLSPRAFFILVLNMEKKFDDQVGEEVCSQKGSIFKEWLHKDYLTFWVKSIHQYSSEKAPVLLIATHAEGKTEHEKIKFFGDVCQILDTKDKSLQGHLDKERMFAVGFHDHKSIEKIKLSIAKVVQKLDHWGKKLPRSWAIFEHFFQDKKHMKIIYTKELLSYNAELPLEIKLEKSEDVHIMLQFFHDIREILHYNQEYLDDIIILDVQWFADAFKNVITDKNHAEKDLVMFAKEWREFNETGELTDTLLLNIWKIKNNGYIEHKNKIMPYMEKLGLLADIGEQNKKWYVPSMNKRQFPVGCFSLYPASSILCYTFDVLPAGIFHRLVANCMQIPWKIFSDGDRGCIFQTAAVFVFCDLRHNILVGMTQTDIQLQVFVTDREGEVDVSTCHQIRERIESILNNLANTFQKNSGFQVAFKCKPTGFCDSKESAVIKESKFIRAPFPCPSCPEWKKHPINTKDITKYWKQELQKKFDPKEEKVSGPSIELILTVVSRKMYDTTCHLLASYFEVDKDTSTRCYEEQVFRTLYKWLCKYPNIDHLKKLEETLKKANQEKAAEYISTFNMAEFQRTDISSPSLPVSEREFKIISKYLIREYTHFVRFLGLPHRDVEKIEENFEKIEERINEALSQTSKECPTLCRQDLCRALTFLERNDVVEALKVFWKPK